MKSFLKLVVTIAILAAFLLGGYYWYRLKQAEDLGEKYPITQAPGDLVRDVARLFESDGTEEPDPEPEPEAGPDAGTDPEPEKKPVLPELPPRELADLEQARVHFDEGEYREAGKLLVGVVSRPSAPKGANRLLDRARLFELLLEDYESNSVLVDGYSYARFTMPGGQSFFVRVVFHDSEKLEFKQEAGLGATVEKSQLRDLLLAKSEDEKLVLFEQEYRRRHTTALSSGALLELARFARTHGLSGHVTYLMEKGLNASGDGMEKELVAKHQQAERSGNKARMKMIRPLAQKLFTGGELAKRIYTGPGIDAPEPHLGPDPRPVGSGGIGEVVRRTPRKSDPEVNRMLEQADALRKTGDEHYLKALPGKPNAATHRKTALDAYTKALGLYEQVEERWNVGLDGTFKDIQERRYQLLKDSH